jgi:solute:Na+ symporter, SSS family
MEFSMNSYSLWMFGLALAYTILLVSLGQVMKKRAKKGDDYFVGGRCFGRWTVAFCITGLFSGSTFIAILELAYFKGVSAMWYGVAEMSHVLIIALVLIGPFRRKMMVTISGLIGDKYGRMAKGIAGAITAFTFPMWSVATALAFASCINAITGIDLMTSVIITATLLYVFLQAGGMWSVAMTQTANFFAYMAMFAVGIYAVLVNPGLDGLAAFMATKPQYADMTGVGLQTILAWFGTFWINVLLAQAAFQMALSCRTPDEGRKGLYIAAGFNVIFIVMGLAIGIAAAAVMPGDARGLVAVPKYLMANMPAPLVGIFTLGIWACALGWGAPCQFSGATSLGRDVGSALNPAASDAMLVRYTKWSLVLLTVLMVVFGFMRSEQAAWWNIFAWTARNGSTFAPVVAALFWPLAGRRGATWALVAGFASGLLWNHLGGWAVGHFYLNTHPVWVAMGVNISTLTLITLFDGGWSFVTPQNGKRWLRDIGLTGAVVFTSVSFTASNWLHSTGLIGMFIFIIILFLWLVTIACTAPRAQVVQMAPAL